MNTHEHGSSVASQCAKAMVVLVSLTVMGSDGGSSEVVRFGICATNISRVLVVPTGASPHGPVRLEIVLDAVGTEQFRSMSTRVLGQTVEITFDGAVLVSTRVLATISSGRMQSREWSNAAAAEEFVRLIGSRALKVPCGPYSR